MIQPRRIISLIFIVPLVVVSIAVFGSLRAAPQQPGERKVTKSPPEVVEDDIVTRRAVCRWAAQPPVLDGKLDDKCWQKGAVIDHFASYWTKTPRQGTFAYLVWDDEALYYAASMTDAELRAFGTQRNDTLWDGDVFELFFKPSATNQRISSFRQIPRCWCLKWLFPAVGLTRLTIPRHRCWDTRPWSPSMVHSINQAIATSDGASKVASRGRPLQTGKQNQNPVTNGSLHYAATIMGRREPSQSL